MENFEIEVNRTTSKILQELAFEHGWSWRSKHTSLRHLDANIFAFELNYKDISTGSLAGNKVSLEQAIELITAEKEKFKDGDWFAVDNCGYDKSETWVGRYPDEYCYTTTCKWGYSDSFLKSKGRKATDEEIKSVLVEEAKRRGLIGGARFKQYSKYRSKIIVPNSYEYDPERRSLSVKTEREGRLWIYNPHVSAGDFGDWAKVVDEPIKMFGYKVTKIDSRNYKFGCEDHIYTKGELRRVIDTLGNLRSELTVRTLVTELEKLYQSD